MVLFAGFYGGVGSPISPESTDIDFLALGYHMEKGTA